ncbi:MAG: YfhO family protein, partial [Oscillospiraceae bacterium]|nr:YfhO family protein [Oscillospiraceae bacterium]
VLWTLMQASTESATDVPLLPLVTSVLRFIPTLITDGQVFGNYSAVSAGGLFAALIPAFVIDVWRGKNRLPVLMWGICLVFLLFPVFCSVFNGFSYPSARWCYMLTFFYIWAGVAVLDGEQFSRADFRLQYKWGFSAVFGLFILCLVIGGYFFKTQSIGGVTSAVVNLGIMYYAAQLLFQDSAANEHGWKKTQRRLLLLVILNLPCIYLIHFYPLNNGALNNYVDTDVSYQQYHTSTQRNIADIQREDTTFFRSDQGNFITLDGTITQFHWPANESVMYGTRTMTTYLSTLDSDVTDFYKAVCDNQNYMLRVIEYGNDNRSRLNYLTGVKYFTAKFDSVARYAGYGFAPWRTEDDVQILKNEYEPSLGYVYPEVIFNSRFGEYSYLDREQIMMQVAVVDDGYDGAAAETNPQSLQLDTEEISCEFQAGDGLIVENNTITVNKANAVLTLKPEPIENSEVYVLFDNFSRIPPSYEDKREQTLGEEPSKLQRDSFALGNLAYQSYGNFDIRVGANGINK